MLRPGSRNLITDVDGILVGNEEDQRLRSGVSVVLCEAPSVASVDVRGGGPGTRETDLLDPSCHVDRIDALCLSGGSAFGLSASDGVMRWLKERGRGLAVADAVVPIVPAAILFDLLNGGDKKWDWPPYRELAYQAADRAGRDFALGNAGAGLGAKAGNLKGGLGSASAVDPASGLQVGALVAVNARGYTTMGDMPQFWAWALEQEREFGGLPPPAHGLSLSVSHSRADLTHDPADLVWSDPRANTTVAVVATNAKLNKVEATKFTEVGYVGRDVDQIVRDLVEAAIGLVRDGKRKEVSAKAHLQAEERVLNALVGANASPATKDKFRKQLRDGELDDKEIEIQLADSGGIPGFEIPGMPGSSIGMINLNDMLGKAFGGRTKTRRLSVRNSYEVLINEESDKLLDNEQVIQEAIKSVENNGIVFLDEIDKICARSERIGADVSREGVQRDLLPLIEGTTVGTKYGPVKTDHVLFIASGAFHVAKPSDLLPELQGRLPIRVELQALTGDDFRRILREPKTSLIKQYIALMATEGVELEFTEDAIDAIADVAVEVNSNVENIGARRLSTVMERVLDEISFEAADKARTKFTIDANYVRVHVGDLAKNADLSKFIL